MDALLRVFDFAGEVHVVHGDLRQRELARMAVHVRHLLVHESGEAVVLVSDEQAVLGAVEIVGNGRLA